VLQRLDCCSARLHSPRIRKPRARIPTLRLLRPPPQQPPLQQPPPQQPPPQQLPQSRAVRTRPPQAGSGANSLDPTRRQSVVGIGPNAAVSVAKAPGDGITGAGPAIITTGSGVGNRLTAEKAAPNRAAFFVFLRVQRRELLFLTPQGKLLSTCVYRKLDSAILVVKATENWL
jgi:hypothetical protein